MIKNLLDSDVEPHETGEIAGESSSVLGLDEPNTVTDSVTGAEEPFIISDIAPETMAETVRKSGLAWSAGIAFFASVVFMLIIGWGADLLFDSSPWGMVGGIVLGSVIGFIQFFRLTSKIFNPDKKMKTGRMLISDDDEKED